MTISGPHRVHASFRNLPPSFSLRLVLFSTNARPGASITHHDAPGPAAKVPFIVDDQQQPHIWAPAWSLPMSGVTVQKHTWIGGDSLG
ncbi:hypothetical protein B7463_g8481, partial [Scytalidium lignicola]